MATGMRTLRLTSRTISMRLAFDVGRAQRHVAGGVVDVQLEPVGAGLLEQPRVVDPPAGRDAVERGHHRNADGGLDPAQMLEVLVGPERHRAVRARSVSASANESLWLSELKNASICSPVISSS